ncbi:hypothetical protein P4S64_24175 [Vibrio sp. M60_M31a]
MNYLIKNANSVFSPQQDVKDIRIQNGVITELGQNLLPNESEKLVDATNCVVYQEWLIRITISLNPY